MGELMLRWSSKNPFSSAVYKHSIPTGLGVAVSINLSSSVILARRISQRTFEQDSMKVVYYSDTTYGERIIDRPIAFMLTFNPPLSPQTVMS